VNVPIPSHDYLFLPGTAWLVQLLCIISSYLHLLLVGIVVGSAVFLLLRRVVFRSHSELDHQLDGRLLKTLPVCISLMITFGVASLLFVQCLYTPYFFCANIFMAPFWMLIPVLLVVGFVSAYLAGRFWRRGVVLLFVLLVPIAFAAILYIMTNNAVLTIMPEHWLQFHRDTARLHVSDPIVLPRLLHNFGATFVIVGLFVAWVGRFAAPTGVAGDAAQKRLAQHASRLGLRWLIFGLFLQIALGFWYVLAISAPIRGQIIGFRTFASLAWYISLALVVVNIITAFKALESTARKSWLYLTTVLPAIGLVGMLLARQEVRAASLGRESAGSFDALSQSPQHGWVVQSQPSAILAFFLVLIIAVIAIAVMVLLALRPRPDNQE